MPRFQDTARETPEAPLLDVSDLTVRFPDHYGQVPVLEEVTLHVGRGEAVGLVGESGCGKSLLGLAVSDLLPPTARVNGAVAFQGRDLYTMRPRERRAIRGTGISVIYQDALTSLNPGMSVGSQLDQVCRLGASAAPEELLRDVELHDPGRILRAKPYQLSGGQRQRVLIALALARAPELVIADEPTTALDVTVEAQIIKLLLRLQTERHFGLLFISHDLAVVSQLTQRVAVMYAGQVVEAGPTQEILTRPRHPYAVALLEASRSLEQRDTILSSIPGHVPPPTHFASGCRFRDRCPNAEQDCATKPALVTHGYRNLACYHPMDKPSNSAKSLGASRTTVDPS